MPSSLADIGQLYALWRSSKRSANGCRRDADQHPNPFGCCPQVALTRLAKAKPLQLLILGTGSRGDRGNLYQPYPGLYRAVLQIGNTARFFGFACVTFPSDASRPVCGFAEPVRTSRSP